MIDPLLYFWLFLKASLFSTGGSGNLPFLHTDLIALGWANEQDFLTALAVGQISPGPTGLWSISLGYLTYGWSGSVFALLALSLPTLLVLLVATAYNRMEKLPPVQDFSRGLSLGVVGLTLSVAFILARSAIIDWKGILICLGALALAYTNRLPMIVILVIAGVVGLIVYGR
jgi:chromate transporter